MDWRAALAAVRVGSTPLVRLTRVVPEGIGEVWLKLESVNPTGSYKDRVALAIIRGALERGDVVPGDRLVEYTGGSTGTALAYAAARVGLRFTAVSSDAFAAVKLRSMVAYGAEVLVEPSEDGAITPNLIARMRDRAYVLADEPGAWYTDQFGNADIRPGYARMGAEIADSLDGQLDVLCAGVGTGGALMGATDGIDETGCRPDVVALEPAESPLLTTGTGGPHRIEGIAVGFVPPFLDRDRITEVRTVEQVDALSMCRRLAVEEGLLCGPSTGLNVVAAIRLAVERGEGSVVATFGVDSGSKYLDGDLFG